MPAESLKIRLSGVSTSQHEKDTRAILQSILDGVQALATKLDADATVTDTNYRAILDAIVLD